MNSLLRNSSHGEPWADAMAVENQEPGKMASGEERAGVKRKRMLVQQPDCFLFPKYRSAAKAVTIQGQPLC